jgi:Protein of unknown function (DUF3999)
VIRWLLASGVAVLAFAVTAFTADLPSPWRTWHYSRSIQTTDTSGPVKLTIPPTLYSRLANGFADLRIVDDRGAEIPFLLYDKNTRAAVETRHAVIRENSFVPGKYTQLVIDLGETTAFHNSLEVYTSETDFIDWVEIAASDDAKTWRIVNDRAPIASFRKENIAGSRRVQYSDNNARFLRVEIFETSHQFPVSSVQIFFTREFREPLRVPLTSAFTIDSTAPANVTRWVADLGPGSFPISGVAIDTTQPQFFRIVHMQNSDDGKEWRDFCSGEVYRYQQGEKQAEALRVFSPEAWHRRYWRIEIVNGSDVPLANAKLSLLAIPYWVLFYPQPGRTYRLIYGNSSAKLPQYDLARTFDYHAEPAAQVVTLGQQESTLNYQDPRPFTERHPYLLWLALIVAIVVLAYTALRALRTPAPAAP